MHTRRKSLLRMDFNPRSLAGATTLLEVLQGGVYISIHAPSRERLYSYQTVILTVKISIHAPSRERLEEEAWKIANN